MGAAANKMDFEKPDIYLYEDIREFLVKSISYLTEKDPSLTLRKFAKNANLDHGHLSRMLNGYRTITTNNLQKMAPHLLLNQEETAFLFLLRNLSESKTQAQRISAFKKILSNAQFKKKNKDNISAHRFLSHWYYPAIRELVRTKEFDPSSKWIRKQLNNRVTETEARDALEFLLENQYIAFDGEDYSIAEPTMNCTGGVYRLAASEYHEQLLEIARDSIYDVDRDLRQIMANTVAVAKDDIEQVRQILVEASQKITSLQSQSKDRDVVYQVSLLAFPLSSTNTKEEAS